MNIYKLPHPKTLCWDWIIIQCTIGWNHHTCKAVEYEHFSFSNGDNISKSVAIMLNFCKFPGESCSATGRSCCSTKFSDVKLLCGCIISNKVRIWNNVFLLINHCRHFTRFNCKSLYTSITLVIILSIVNMVYCIILKIRFEFITKFYNFLDFQTHKRQTATCAVFC